MEKLVLEINNKHNLDYLIDIIKKFSFIKSIKTEKIHVKKKREDLPVDWAENNSDIMALAGIWKDKPRNIEEIREKAWKRN